MSQNLRILAAQLNPVVGDITGNLNLARATCAKAIDEGAHLIVFPEHFIMGYPAEDLVLRPSAVDAAMQAVRTLAAETSDGPSILIGTPWAESGKLYNSACLLGGGLIKARYDKVQLPNYGVFDEKRYYSPGSGAPLLVDLHGVRIGVAICEDIWSGHIPRANSQAGAQLLIVLNASPWRRSIDAERAAAFDEWSDAGLPYLFVNQVGGQDELVFDGASFFTNSIHSARHCLFRPFTSDTGIAEFSAPRRCFNEDRPGSHSDLSGQGAAYRAAMQGLGDYVRKNGFPGVILGMSGGIDSALTAAIAADTLGPDKVWCVMMPSRYTSRESLEDARECAETLGCRYDLIGIQQGISAFDTMLAPLVAGRPADIMEENIQSRLRGMILMALSNKFGHMVVTTGNKSELAVGYATLYGDMCGGYNPLKDFYKTEVFELARWRNRNTPADSMKPATEVIPERIILRPPSAELREDQKDEDSLPPYPVLDAILKGLIEDEEDIHSITKRGYDPEVVRRVETLLRNAEYKRRQSAPGPKIGSRNFGRDRRYPITNRFRNDEW